MFYCFFLISSLCFSVKFSILNMHIAQVSSASTNDSGIKQSNILWFLLTKGLTEICCSNFAIAGHVVPSFLILYCQITVILSQFRLIIWLVLTPSIFRVYSNQQKTFPFRRKTIQVSFQALQDVNLTLCWVFLGEALPIWEKVNNILPVHWTLQYGGLSLNMDLQMRPVTW